MVKLSKTSTTRYNKSASNSYKIIDIVCLMSGGFFSCFTPCIYEHVCIVDFSKISRHQTDY